MPPLVEGHSQGTTLLHRGLQWLAEDRAILDWRGLSGRQQSPWGSRGMLLACWELAHLGAGGLRWAECTVVQHQQCPQLGSPHRSHPPPRERLICWVFSPKHQVWPQTTHQVPIPNPSHSPQAMGHSGISFAGGYPETFVFWPKVNKDTRALLQKQQEPGDPRQLSASKLGVLHHYCVTSNCQNTSGHIHTPGPQMVDVMCLQNMSRLGQ